MPRPVHEFNWDQETILVTTLLFAPVPMNHQLIWNMKGIRRMIPLAVRENARTLLDDYRMRIKVFDKVPKSVGLIYWEQTVPIPEAGSRDRDSTHKEPKP